MPQATDPPKRRILLGYLVAQLAFGLVAMTICIPSMQRWGAIFGASQSSVQLTFSGFVVAYGGMQLLYGPLSDRLGRRRILLVGLALAAAGSVFAALANTLPLLTAARVLQGEEREHVELIRAWMSKVEKPADDWYVDPDPPRYTD